jgi:hypothetical protein
MALNRAFRGLSVGVLLAVAGLAEGLEVRVPMGSSGAKGNNVMNVLGGNQAASGLAEFAERMPGNVGVADLFPAAVV